MSTRQARLFQFVLVLAFWGYSLWNLDRSPQVSEDEPWILSPGYVLFTRGVYGSGLFTGYYGMEAHYLEFMPLMPLVLGATTWGLGMGVWQMRFAPVVIGTLLLAVTCALATRLDNALTGAWSGVLLISWQWIREGSGQLLSGIPLTDLARIARYDILAALLGVAALLLFVRAWQTQHGRYAGACGLLIGLAGLTHIYGLFWWAAIGVMVFGRPSRTFDSAAAHRRNVFLIVGLPLLLWAMWAAVLLYYWSDFIGQMRLNVSCFAGQPCFDVGQIWFYWRNLVTEPYRYHLNTVAPLTRLGGWLLVLGVPGALLWLMQRVVRYRDVKALWLVVPSLVIPLLLAVLMPRKVFNYLMSVAPLWGIALAWAASRWFAAAHWVGRTAITFGMIGIVTQGLLAASQAQLKQGDELPLVALTAQLRQILPATGRILGPHVYWIGLANRDYRSCGLPSFLSNPDVGPPQMTFGEALERIAPRIVLLDGPNAAIFADASTPYAAERHRAWLAYLERHRARVAFEWRNADGRLRLRVYVLDDST